MNLLRCVCVAAIAALIPLTASAITVSGTIRDETNSRPIPNVTVFVYWGHTVKPLFYDHYWWSCEGTAAAVTDAQGRYQITLPLTTSLTKTGDRAPQIRLSAAGYYDNRMRSDGYSRGSYPSSLSWRQWQPGDNLWSPTLMPLKNAPVDAQLIALDSSTTEYQFGAQANDVCDPSAAFAQFKLARWQDDVAALCPKNTSDPSPPSFGIFRALRLIRPDRPAGTQTFFAFVDRTLVEPLLPKDEKAKLSAVAMANVCTWIRWQTNDGQDKSGTRRQAMLLRVPVIDETSGKPMPDLPIRVLWGWRAEQHPAAPGYYSVDYFALRGYLMRTTANGFADLPVTRDMIDEEHLETDRYNEQLTFAIVPMSADRISFTSGTWRDTPLDGAMLYQRFVDHVTRLHHADQLERVPISEYEKLSNNGDPSFARDVVPYGRIWHRPPAVQALAKLVAQEEQRSTRTSRHFLPIVIHTYTWNWSGLALLWRSYALLDSKVDIEADSVGWSRLARDQVKKTFDKLCADPDQALTGGDALQALSELWWMERQYLGPAVADSHAKDRAKLWDHGTRCTYKDGKLMSGGPDPADFHSYAMCPAWQALRAKIDANTRIPPPKLSELKLDFSNRRDACPSAPNNGAFQ